METMAYENGSYQRKYLIWWNKNTARILKQVKSTFLNESTFLYIFLYSLFQDVFASHFVNHVIFINTSDPNYSFTNTKTSPYRCHLYFVRLKETAKNKRSTKISHFKWPESSRMIMSKEYFKVLNWCKIFVI